MNFRTRVAFTTASVLVTLLLQVMAIEAVFFPPSLPFRLDNTVPIIWDPADEKVLSTWAYDATRLDRRDAEEAIAAVERCMCSYPQWILDKYVNKVVLVRTLAHTDGRFVGGMAVGRNIVLTAGSALDGAFHHELAHVLSSAGREKFDEEAWQAANPPGFTYGRRARAWSRLRGDLRLAFVSTYAMTTIREDFAESAAELFSDGYDSTFNGIRSVALKRKAKILIDFYQSIDPVFTEEYFRKL